VVAGCLNVDPSVLPARPRPSARGWARDARGAGRP